MVIRFFDTSALLEINLSQLKQYKEKFYISPTTIEELESIKSANNKDENLKYQARLLVRWLDKHPERWATHRAKVPRYLEDTNDARILSDAVDLFRIFAKNKTITNFELYSNDLLFKLMAENHYEVNPHVDIHATVNILSVKNDDNYCGFIERQLTDEELAKLYENPNENSQNLLTNQYLLIRDREGKVNDIQVWTGFEMKPIQVKPFISAAFGKVEPKKGDPYQKMLFDSLRRNQVTLVKGKPGAGKSYLSLAYLISELEAGKIQKIVMFCNPVATMHSARLGFYPGTKDEKLMDAQIGNFLRRKFGDQMGVEKLMDKGQLELLPMSDIRGYDTGSMSIGVYITEAQNMDISLMKLALQRLGENSICIIDGDCKAQVDDINFSGSNNGMRRMSQVFRGSSLYGEVELRQIHRSKIAEIADKM